MKSGLGMNSVSMVYNFCSSCFWFFKIVSTISHPESLFCVLVLFIFHVVLYQRIMGNKAFFTHLLEEDKINISLVLFFISQTFF